jgi:hypothetical protein
LEVFPVPRSGELASLLSVVAKSEMKKENEELEYKKNILKKLDLNSAIAESERVAQA